MSTQINDGGPAFPLFYESKKYGWVVKGMSLRDWFAGQALNGFLSANATFRDTPHPDELIFASVAYRVADAMLKTREAKP